MTVELVDDLHGAHELADVHGLLHEGAGLQVVGVHNLLFRAGGGQDHDRDLAQVRVGLDLGQHLQAIHPRQVQVEQDQAGPGSAGVGGPPVQEIQGRGAVGHGVQLSRGRGGLQRLPGEHDVARVVFDEQDPAGDLLQP